MQAIADWETIRLLMPELVLVLAAVYLFVMGMTVGNRAWWASFTLGVLAIAGMTLWRQESVFWVSLATGGEPWFRGPLWIDVFGELARNLAWLIGVLVTLLSYRSAPQRLTPEFLGSLLLAVAGMMVVGRANDLVLLFVGLELISIPTYAMLFIGRVGRASMEATAKYFFLSLLSSALLLYGFSFLYGISGTTRLAWAGGDGVAAVFGRSESVLVPIALVLVMAGIGFKMAVVPFQFYAPDVYQGTSHANAGLLATLPKLAGVVVLVRLLGQSGPQTTPFSWELLALLSIVTMTFGNTCALWQRNLRRLMAYSSIAHAGYMLMGLAVVLAMGSSFGIDGGGETMFGGLAGTMFYVAVYIPATLGVFAAWTVLSSDGAEVESLSDLHGLGRRRPVVAALLAIFLFSLAGIPPLAGFWGKLGILTSVLDGGLRWALGEATDPRGAWLLALAVIGAINAAIAAAYYLRVIAAMYFQPSAAGSERTEVPLATGPMAAVVVSAWLVVIFGLMPGALFQATHQAERMLTPSAAVSPDQATGPESDQTRVARWRDGE